VTQEDFNKVYKYFINCETDDLELFNPAQQRVIESCNPDFCFQMAEFGCADVLALGKVVLQYGKAEVNKRFAKHRKGADIKAHQAKVIASDDLDQIIKFAKDVEGADIPLLEEAMIASGNVRYCKKFAKEVPGANKDALKKVYKYPKGSWQSEHRREIAEILGVSPKLKTAKTDLTLSKKPDIVI